MRMKVRNGLLCLPGERACGQEMTLMLATDNCSCLEVKCQAVGLLACLQGTWEETGGCSTLP